MNHFLKILFCVVFFSNAPLFSKTATAVEDKASANKLYGEGVPETGKITCQAGDYTVVFDATPAWTISEMKFKNKTFSLNNGFHGAVMTPKGGKWWGTGHGEGGREIVHSLKLIVDGEKQPIGIGKTYSGKKISFLKKATIWKFKAQSEVTLNSDYVLERIQLEAIEDCELRTLYCFMHCFPPSTTKWLAEFPNGELKEGVFKSNDSFAVKNDTQWLSQHDPILGLDLFCYTPKIISGNKSMSKIWDKKHYHKFYLQQNWGQAFKAGEKLDFSVIVKALPNENGDWDVSKSAATELKKLFPSEQKKSD